MAISKSLCVAGFAACVVSIAAIIEIASRTEEPRQLPVETASLPAPTDPLTEPKRVRTSIIRNGEVQQEQQQAAYRGTPLVHSSETEPGRTKTTQPPTAADPLTDPKRVRTMTVGTARPAPAAGPDPALWPKAAATPQPWPGEVPKVPLEPAAQKPLGFDYSRYQAIDLDEVMEHRRPDAGVDIYQALPLKITVALTSYAEPCDAGRLRRAMIAAAIARTIVDAAPVTRCITIRTTKGRPLSIYIQDPVAAFLPKEVPLGSTVILYVIHVFTGPGGPGLLVNEFTTEDAIKQTRPG